MGPIRLLDVFSQYFCRHEFIRDRQPDGRVMLRCMKCMKRTPHVMLELTRWRLRANLSPLEEAAERLFPAADDRPARREAA